MSSEEIQKGNRIIAEFEGRSFSMGTISDFKNREVLPKYVQDKIKYHSDWKLLMPIVEIIEGLGYDFIINASHVIVVNSENDYEHDDMANSKKEAIWNAVVHFIKFYRQQLKK